MPRITLAALCLFLAAALPTQACAQQFFKKSELLAEMFPSARRVAPVELTLTKAELASAEATLGHGLPQSTYTFYEASAGNEVLGWCLFDDQIGQHEPITFGVQVGADGALVRLEVVTYREKRGAEIRSGRFRGQFVGKRSGDPLKLNAGIQAVSGATYSSRSATVVAARALLLASLLRSRGASVGAAEPVATAPDKARGDLDGSAFEPDNRQ